MLDTHQKRCNLPYYHIISYFTAFKKNALRTGQCVTDGTSTICVLYLKWEEACLKALMWF